MMSAQHPGAIEIMSWNTGKDIFIVRRKRITLVYMTLGRHPITFPSFKDVKENFAMVAIIVVTVIIGIVFRTVNINVANIVAMTTVITITYRPNAIIESNVFVISIVAICAIIIVTNMNGILFRRVFITITVANIFSMATVISIVENINGSVSCRDG